MGHRRTRSTRLPVVSGASGGCPRPTTHPLAPLQSDTRDAIRPAPISRARSRPRPVHVGIPTSMLERPHADDLAPQGPMRCAGVHRCSESPTLAGSNADAPRTSGATSPGTPGEWLCPAKTPSGRRSSSEMRPPAPLQECRRSRKRVLVVQSARYGFGAHERTRRPSTSRFSLRGACRSCRRAGNVGTQRAVRTPAVVVSNLLAQDRAEMRLGQRNHPIQALAPDRADDPLADRVRLGARER